MLFTPSLLNIISLQKFKNVLVALLFLICFSQLLEAQIVQKKISNDPDEYLELAGQAIKNGYFEQAKRYCLLGLEKRPDYVDLHFTLGKVYYMSGQPDSARYKLKQVIRTYPRYKDAYTLLINMELREGRFEEALCYSDDALYYYPYDKDFMIKRMSILDMGRDRRAADKWAEKLVSTFFADTSVTNFYVRYKLEQAQIYYKQGNLLRAKYEYQRVLEQNPNNSQAIQAMVNLENRSGNKQAALDLIDMMLQQTPNSYEYLTKKASLLEELRRYPEALEVVNRLIVLYPRDVKVQRMNYDMKMAAGRYFISQDPYLVFQDVLSRTPSNREALDYVINLATARGLHNEALAFENRALSFYPTDQQLKLKKLGTLEALKKYTQAADLAEELWLSNPNGNGYLDRLIEFKLLAGKSFLQDLEYDSAIAIFQQVLGLSPGNPVAYNYAINTLNAQKRFPEAISMLNEALTYYPNDELLLLKKAGILQESGNYDEASEIASFLYTRKPDNTRFANLLVDIKMANAKMYMEEEDYDAAREEYKTVIKVQPNNLLALNGLINLESATQQYDSALVYTEKALTLTPGSKNILLKKSSVTESLKRYKEAYGITADLMKRYPYSSKIRQTYIDQVLASGREYNKLGFPDSAIMEFNKVLEMNPKDTFALAYIINILSDQKQYDSALIVANDALFFYPGNEYFTTKRANILESQTRYVEASLAADSVAKMNPSFKNIDYASYLKSKSMKSEIGLMFLRTTFDSATVLTRGNISTIQYSRIINKGSWAARFNYAARPQGTGLQAEVDWYRQHNLKTLSYFNLGIANNIIFPSIKLNYTITRTLRNPNWEAELGARFLRFNRLNLNLISLGAAGGHYFKDFYLNLRYYALLGEGNLYHSAILSARQYLNTKTDYLLAGVGVGTTPDEFGRANVNISNLGVSTYSMMMGYNKVFNYRHTFSIIGTWYNQKLPSKVFRSQYDIFVSYRRKF